MGLTKVETQILWGTATSKTVDTNTVQTSDAFSLHETTIAASIQTSVDNQGTPENGDTCTVQIAYSAGDLLGNGGDDYDTPEHSTPYIIMDTYATNTPGEDPAIHTGGELNRAAKGGKLLITCPQAATRNMVIRARLIELRNA